MHSNETHLCMALSSQTNWVFTGQVVSCASTTTNNADHLPSTVFKQTSSVVVHIKFIRTTAIVFYRTRFMENILPI